MGADLFSALGRTRAHLRSIDSLFTAASAGDDGLANALYKVPIVHADLAPPKVLEAIRHARDHLAIARNKMRTVRDCGGGVEIEIEAP